MTYKPPGGMTQYPEVLQYWDASRAAVAMTCWRKHWLQNVRGLRLRGVPSVHLTWGKAYHACAELFDKLRVHFTPFACVEEAKLSALALAFELSWDAERNQPCWGEYFTLYRCTDPATRVHKRDPVKQVRKASGEQCKWAKGWFEEMPTSAPGKCSCGAEIEQVRKWLPEHKKKTRANLLRAVAAYCDEPGLAPYGFENGEAVTEVQHCIALPLLGPNGEDYQLVVNIDSIVDHNGWAAIRERKTTGIAKLDHRFWGTYEMNPQVDSYDLAGRAVYADEDRPPRVLLEVTKVGNAGEIEIVRQVLEIPEGRAEEWLTELQALITEAEQRTLSLLLSGVNEAIAFPRNTTACHGKFGTCAFWKVCIAAPEVREQIIAEDYKVEHWDPLAAEVTASAVEEV